MTKLLCTITACAAAVFLCAAMSRAGSLDGTLWQKNYNPEGTQTYKAFYGGHLYTAGPDNETGGWTMLAFPCLEAPAGQGAYTFMSCADRRRIPFLNRGFIDFSSTCHLGVADPDNGSATVCTVEQTHHLGFGTVRRTLCARYTLQQRDWVPDDSAGISRYARVPSVTVAGQTFACMCDYPPATFVWYFDFSGTVYERALKTDNGTYEETGVAAGTWSRTGSVLTALFNDAYRAERNIGLLAGGYPERALAGLFKILQITGFTADAGEPFPCDCTRMANYEKVLNRQ
jgi:hypothetical protein